MNTPPHMEQMHKTDVLTEAGQMLSEPSRNTKRKILIAMNLAFVAVLLLHLVIQLIEFGTLPDPARDMIFYPLIILINSISAIYNLRVLFSKIEASKGKEFWSKWSSLGITMILSLLIVHTNPNLATSLLVDFGFSVILLFVIGTLVGQRAAVIWFIVTGISLYMAYLNVGPGFEYHLLTPDQVTEINKQLKAGDPGTQQYLDNLKEKRLLPLPIGLYASVWFIFMAIAFLAVYFESNMISKVLGVIPAVIQKINVASSEKNKLEQENMRMGMELDVARKIQKLMLPKGDEFKQCHYLEVAARMDAASEVGGDFYEFLPQEDGSVIIAVGDVTDHGLQSGIVMLMAQSTIRSVIDEQRTSLSQALVRINEVLFKNIRHRMKDYRNLTLSLARIDNGKIQISGQHENLLVYRQSIKKAELISTTELGIYIGLIDEVSEHIHEASLTFEPGDVLMWYTDGLTEAQNKNGEFFGEKKLLDCFSKYADLPTEQITDSIFSEVYLFTENLPLQDDISTLIIKRK